MNIADMSEKEQVRFVLQHVMGYFVLDVTATGWRTPEFPRGTSAPAGFHWPIAFWNMDAECWMTRDIATDPTFFDPLHDMNDTWLIMDHIKPGRNDDPDTFLTRAHFVDILENYMRGWWSYTRERFCQSLCQHALRAYGVIDIDGNVLEIEEKS